MALILKDRVQETSTTTGTGTLTLAGAVTQFQTFSSAVGNGNTTYYTIYNAGGSDWEVGIGTVGAGTLARTTVLASSNANALVNFTGTLYVFGDYPAGKAAYLDASGVINNTTFNATTSVITPIVQATNSGGLALKNSAGTTQISMGAGGGDNASINVSTNLNGTNAQIDISPTGTGHVHINPTGSGSIEINPTSLGTINNMSLGATTAAAAKVTTLNIQSGLTLATLPGTSGQVLTSAGTGAVPTWTTPTTGTVTSVTGTAPVVSSGGATPAISMAAATGSVNGYLTSTDWTTFNSKGSGTVTSVNLTASTGISVSGGPITGSGSITVTNTAPDQTVVLTAGTGISTSGTYPSFTITNTGVAAYPGAGIAVSTGSAWTTSLTAPSGAIVGTTDTQTLTNKTLTNPTVTNYVESVVAIGTVTTTNTIALTNGTVQTATLTASTACTFTMPTATAGKSFILLLKQAATVGLGTATFTGVKWGTAGAPTITATAGKMDILTFVADGTNWYGSIAQGYTP